MVEWEETKEFIVPVAGAGIAGYAGWEASKRYPLAVAGVSAAIVGYMVQARV